MSLLHIVCILCNMVVYVQHSRLAVSGICNATDHSVDCTELMSCVSYC